MGIDKPSPRALRERDEFLEAVHMGIARIQSEWVRIGKALDDVRRNQVWKSIGFSSMSSYMYSDLLPGKRTGRWYSEMLKCYVFSRDVLQLSDDEMAELPITRISVLRKAKVVTPETRAHWIRLLKDKDAFSRAEIAREAGLFTSGKKPDRAGIPPGTYRLERVFAREEVELERIGSPGTGFRSMRDGQGDLYIDVAV
jgi:hypothetical protein